MGYIDPKKVTGIKERMITIRYAALYHPITSLGFNINKDIKNFYEFTENDFELVDYRTHPQIKNIPVAK